MQGEYIFEPTVVHSAYKCGNMTSLGTDGDGSTPTAKDCLARILSEDSATCSHTYFNFDSGTLDCGCVEPTLSCSADPSNLVDDASSTVYYFNATLNGTIYAASSTHTPCN